ncbi:MEKHLA domain-containing protein [Streptomyces zhihengii]|uniref:MEKHLA domain-containing protein n=1 Tax=Streptomyces zhihengii TaxID=1818004 RepID=UPI00339E1BC8
MRAISGDMAVPPSPCPAAATDVAQLVLESHLRWAGVPLCPQPWDQVAEAVEWLYADAPFGLLVHDTGDDPRFIYANRAAQMCFGYDWTEFTSLPSRLSAPPGRRTEREEFLARVRSQGYADGYRGLRRAKNGEEFWIEDVAMWELVDSAGVRHGQAAIFRSVAERRPLADRQ